MSMMCRPKWPFLHMYRSHDVRHVEFRGLTGSQRTPRVWGVTRKNLLTEIKVNGIRFFEEDEVKQGVSRAF